ncbi:MAG TPA: tetratricopeptide repeat protein [Thermoanaerobaculia bacterium]|nr:tetratricopeptide repeat protein [Thermoanaerobaculia bacterium]
MSSRHPEDFELLCYTAGELEETEFALIRSHVEECSHCSIALTELRQVDSGLRAGTPSTPAGLDGFLPDDPFRERPERSFERAQTQGDGADRALEFARRGGAEVDALLGAAGGPPGELKTSLDHLSLEDPAARYLLLYALDEAVRQVSDAPARFLRFADAVLVRLGREDPTSMHERGEADLLVPLSTLIGQAHQLAGQAANWTGELEKSRLHLENAYRLFPRESAGDEIRLALTELDESQRRSFAGSPEQGLLLAQRARETFDRFGLDDFSARARVGEGIALSLLGRDEDALRCFRGAIPVFEALGLWRNSVAVVNNLGFSLARLGRLDEARREFSRALTKVSRERHPALLGFVRYGLARVLFFGGRYSDAAKSFSQAARLFEEREQTGDVLAANLWEIESWARGGDASRARHRLDIFRAAVERAQAFDAFLVHQLEDALAGRDPALEKIAELRESAENTLREKFAPTG